MTSLGGGRVVLVVEGRAVAPPTAAQQRIWRRRLKSLGSSLIGPLDATASLAAELRAEDIAVVFAAPGPGAESLFSLPTALVRPEWLIEALKPAAAELPCVKEFAWALASTVAPGMDLCLIGCV